MRKTYLPMLIGVSLILFLSGLNLGLTQTDTRITATADEFDENLHLFGEIIALIQRSYVDEDKTTTKQLFEGAINGMLGTLDPHSQWMPPVNYNEFQVETQGQFGGLGIKIDIIGGWLTVVQPLEDTPAMEAGIRAGDKIIEIEGESTRGITIQKAVEKLRGPQGTDVSIVVMRRTRKSRSEPWKTERKEYTITRDIIHLSSVPHKYMLANNVGYVRLTDFKADSAKELDEALQELEAQGMEALVFDLRFNQGGLLNVAVEVSSLFLPRNSPVVSIRDRQGREEVHRARSRHDREYPIAMLVNQWSASASEIVAGALQDYHRAILIGPLKTKTFGKGSVQTVEQLEDGSALKITTARYYTPNGQSIHEKGLTPDIEVDVDETHEFALLELDRLGIPPERYRLPEKSPEPEPESEPAAAEEEESAPRDEPVTEEDIFPDMAEGAGAVVEAVDEDTETWDEMVARAVDLLTSYRIIAAGNGKS